MSRKPIQRTPQLPGFSDDFAEPIEQESVEATKEVDPDALQDDHPGVATSPTGISRTASRRAQDSRSHGAAGRTAQIHSSGIDGVPEQGATRFGHDIDPADRPRN